MVVTTEQVRAAREQLNISGATPQDLAILASMETNCAEHIHATLDEVESRVGMETVTVDEVVQMINEIKGWEKEMEALPIDTHSSPLYALSERMLAMMKRHLRNVQVAKIPETLAKS